MNNPEHVAARREILELSLTIQPRISEIANLLEPATDRSDAARRIAEGLNLSLSAAHHLLAQSLESSLAGYRRAASAAELKEISSTTPMDRKTGQ